MSTNAQAADAVLDDPMQCRKDTTAWQVAITTCQIAGNPTETSDIKVALFRKLALVLPMSKNARRVCVVDKQK